MLFIFIMIENKLSQNVLLFFCNLICQLCLDGPVVIVVTLQLHATVKVFVQLTPSKTDCHLRDQH